MTSTIPEIMDALESRPLKKCVRVLVGVYGTLTVLDLIHSGHQLPWLSSNPIVIEAEWVVSSMDWPYLLSRES